jgi:hypothetical protein
MATRPCKPGADVKQIWQLLLPDTPFPACGTQQNTGADASERAPAREPPTQEKRRDGAPARRG